MFRFLGFCIDLGPHVDIILGDFGIIFLTFSSHHRKNIYCHIFYFGVSKFGTAELFYARAKI